MDGFNPAAYPELAAYEVLERIGEGTFSVVWRARHRVTGEDVALKVVVPTSGPARTENEVQLLLQYGWVAQKLSSNLSIHLLVHDSCFCPIGGLTVWLGSGCDFIVEFKECIRQDDRITIVMRYFKHAPFKVRTLRVLMLSP